jgi:hypothetical protein
MSENSTKELGQVIQPYAIKTWMVNGMSRSLRRGVLDFQPPTLLRRI